MLEHNTIALSLFQVSMISDLKEAIPNLEKYLTFGQLCSTVTERTLLHNILENLFTQKRFSNSCRMTFFHHLTVRVPAGCRLTVK